MSGPHPVAAALAKLYELVEAAAEHRPETRVDFGPVSGFSERCAVGIAVDTDGLIEVAADVAGGAGSDDHTIDVPCSAVVWQGNADTVHQLARMVEAYELVDLVRDVLVTHPQLGLPCVSSARIVREQYQPTGDPGALINFTVRVEAYRTT